MEKFVALFIIFLLGNFCIWECSADSRDGVAVPFPLNTRLVCNVPNPNPEKSGEDGSIPEDIVRVQLQPPARHNLTVWTPKESGYRLPEGKLNRERLLQFLGADINENVQSVMQPTTPAPNAFQFLPLDGFASGGDLRGFFQPEEVTIPRLAERNEIERAVILNWLDGFGQDRLGNCPLVSNWTQLPNTYFPRWYSAGSCSGTPCSFPEGLTCEPEIDEDRLVYATALRWDCCWNYIRRKWEWNCGWRRVRIPIVVDCHCGCDARFTDD